MVDVFLEACGLLCCPLMIAIIFIDAALPMSTNCADDGDNEPVWRYVFQAYIRAALLEESVKYFAIRRLLHKSYVVDARSLMVYGALSGMTFGVLENITYALMGGMVTAVVRSFLTVPLHASTGLMIGANLVHYRFIPQEGGGSSLLGSSPRSDVGANDDLASLASAPPLRLERLTSQVNTPGPSCVSAAW